MKTKKINKTQQKIALLTFRRAGGFTLFELLVSISIIAVLTAIAVVSYGGLNKKARDSRRIADLEKIRISLESFRQIGSSYPATLTNVVSAGLLDGVPVDPKTKTVYSYAPLTSGTTYRVCAYMEDVGSTSSSVAGCSGLPSGYAGYYKVVNP